MAQTTNTNNIVAIRYRHADSTVALTHTCDKDHAILFAPIDYAALQRPIIASHPNRRHMASPALRTWDWTTEACILDCTVAHLKAAATLAPGLFCGTSLCDLAACHDFCLDARWNTSRTAAVPIPRDMRERAHREGVMLARAYPFHCSSTGWTSQSRKFVN